MTEDRQKEPDQTNRMWAEGTGWIELAGFGHINPRSDEVGGGRSFFSAKLLDGRYAKATGSHLQGGPETWQFEYEEPFLLSDYEGNCIEVRISPLVGQYGISFEPSEWPEAGRGAW